MACAINVCTSDQLKIVHKSDWRSLWSAATWRSFGSLSNDERSKDYQSCENSPHSKGCRHLKLPVAFDFNLHNGWMITPMTKACERSTHAAGFFGALLGLLSLFSLAAFAQSQEVVTLTADSLQNGKSVELSKLNWK